MTPTVVTLLTAIIVLQIKHFIFDYPLQTGWQLRNKATYGHPGGFLHSGLHALGTSAVFFVITPSLAVGIGIVVVEFLVHYHLDWAKGQFNRMNDLTTRDAMYWWGIGLDQMLHHLTYVAIVAVLAATSLTA